MRIGRIEVTLVELGWNRSLQKYFDDLSRPDLAPAHVTSVLKDHYRLRTETGELLARLSGRYLFEVATRSELPAVGDWVAMELIAGGNRATIHHVLPRLTKISRKVSGREAEEQVIAANVDTVFIVSALTHEFNLRRIERYLALVWDSGAQPVIILNKADLANDMTGLIGELEFIAPGVPVHVISAIESSGLEALQSYLAVGQTVAFIGSSGVGKSTIINRLVGTEVQPTLPVREHDDRGRHTTTSRELFMLRGAGMVIDTPECASYSFGMSTRVSAVPSTISSNSRPIAAIATAHTSPSQAAPFRTRSVTGSSRMGAWRTSSSCKPSRHFSIASSTCMLRWRPKIAPASYACRCGTPAGGSAKARELRR